MSSDPFDDKNNLPPWLRDVPLPPRPRDTDARAEPPAPASPPALASAAEVPEWLRESQNAAPPAPATPDWLSSQAPEPAPTQSADQSALPDWLRDTQSSPAPAPSAEPLPNWLSDTQPTPAPAPSAAPLPDWLSDLAGPTTPAPEPPAPFMDAAPPPSSDENQPSWLRESQPTAAVPPAPAALPDWLSEMADAPNPPALDPGAQENPGWLNNLSTDTADEPVLPASDGAAAIPEWLRDASNSRETPAAASPEVDLWADDSLATSPQSGPSAANTPVDSGVPSWLRDAAGDDADTDITAEPFSFEGATGTPQTSGDADISIEPFSFEGATGTPQTPVDADIIAEPFFFDSEPSAPQPPAAPAPSAPAWLSNASGGEDSAETVPDWLKDAVSQSEELAEVGPAAPDVPLWLQDLDTTPATAAPSAPAAAAPAQTPPAPSAQGNLPDWLQSAAAAPSQAPPPQAAPAPIAQGNLPDWLQSAAAAPVPPPMAAAPAPSAQGNLPDWLQSSSATPPPAEDVPAWLRDSQPSQPPAAATPSPLPTAEVASSPVADIPAWLQDTPPAPAAAAENLPDWLRPATPAQPPVNLPVRETPAAPPAAFASLADTSAPPPTAPAAGEALPDWLRPAAPAPAADTSRGQDLPPWLRDEAEEQLPNAGASGGPSLPAWLRGAPTDAPPPAASAPNAQAAPTSFDWLGIDEPASPRAPAAGESEFFGGTELPAWLRPPEPEPPKAISPADARSLDWLTRLGVQDEPESVSTVAAPVSKLKPPIAPTRTSAQIEALALLEQLAATPYPEAVPIPETPLSVWRWIGLERVLYLVLLIALIVALVVPVPASLGLNTPPTAEGADQLFAQLAKLNENDVVLVGYEWDARRNGELRPLEQAVLGYLIQKKVKLVLISTDPQGTLLLFDFRDQLERAGYRKGGEDYILLGYKPGAELALRSLAQDFRGVLHSDFQGNDASISALATGTDANNPRLASLNNLSMMLVLADESSDVQGWMEQVHRVAKQVPLAFLLPAETTPQVQPYLSQPGIYHLAGKQGALAFQSLSGGTGMSPEQIALEAGQQRLSLLVFVALFFVGAIAIGVSAAARKGKRT